MKILYVYGKSVDPAGYLGISQSLTRMGHDVLLYSEKAMDVIVMSEEDVVGLKRYIKEHKVDLVMTVHFIMNVALASYQTAIRYISILWDAPYTDIFNILGRMDHIWVSTFDKIDRERLLAGGIQHVLYQPLCVNTQELCKWNREIQNTLQGHYIHDITFVGRLYEENLYDEHLRLIPPELIPYFNSIFEEAAFKWDGVNRIYGKTGEEILQYMQTVNPDLPIVNNQDIEDTRWFEIFYLMRKLGNIERIAVLNLLAEYYHVTFYTDSASAGEVLENVEIKQAVRWGAAASLLYAGSKVNLNISLKGIEGGTALRIMDIIGAGGFALSSYCEETAELFEEDKEIVMFKSPEELVEKAGFYLAHDKEREQIARAGHEKVMRCYTYDQKMKQLLDWVMEN